MIYLPLCDLHLSSLFWELPSNKMITQHYNPLGMKVSIELYHLTLISLEGRLLHIFLGCVAVLVSDFHLTSDCWKGTFHGRPACTMSTVQHA